MFLSSQTLYRLKDEFFPDQSIKLSSNSFLLTLGGQAAATTANGEMQQLSNGNTISVGPGQLAYLLTEEIVSISGSYMAFISLDTQLKFRGMDDVSGFHISPGYSGRLIFAVSNDSSNDIVLQKGDKIFRMWVAQLDMETESTTQTKQIDKISSEMLSTLSQNRPNIFSVDSRLSKIERQVNIFFSGLKWVGVTIATVIIGLVIREVFSQSSSSQENLEKIKAIELQSEEKSRDAQKQEGD